RRSCRPSNLMRSAPPKEVETLHPSLKRGGTMPNTAVPKTAPTPARAFTAAPKSKQWRVVDYVTTAVLGIAVGLVFWVLALSWKVLELAFQAFPPSIGLIAGLWVLAGPLAGAIIRKP